MNVEKVSMTHRPSNPDKDSMLLGQANRALWVTAGHGVYLSSQILVIFRGED